MRTLCSTPQLEARLVARSGFSLIELLAIVAILAVLACLQLPALAKATGRTKRALCASNLRQIDLALQVYGGEYSDKLPANGVGNWAWDVRWNVGLFLDQYGAGWKVLYCPGTAPLFTDADNYRLYNYSPNNFRVLGYVMTLPGTLLIPTNFNNTLTPQSITYAASYLPPPLPAKRVLLADATISAFGQNNPSLKATYNWTNIVGGYTKRHLSPHLAGTIPAGGNVAMLDGHVEWRTLDPMLPRSSGGSSSPPAFWW